MNTYFVDVECFDHVVAVFKASGRIVWTRDFFDAVPLIYDKYLVRVVEPTQILEPDKVVGHGAIVEKESAKDHQRHQNGSTYC